MLGHIQLPLDLAASQSPSQTTQPQGTRCRCRLSLRYPVAQLGTKERTRFSPETADTGFSSWLRNTNVLNSRCRIVDLEMNILRQELMQTAAELQEGICKYYEKFKEEEHAGEEKGVQGPSGAQTEPWLTTVSVLGRHLLLTFKAEWLRSGLGWNDCDLVTHSHF